MGLGEDILVLLGILPLERPIKPKKVNEKTFFNEGILYSKTKRLQELNGQYVWASDFHCGAVAGELIYNSVLGDSYILNDCSGSGQPKILKVHDLEHIW
jgi:hypothetical protein